MFKEFFTGGPQVREAKKKIAVLTGQRRLSQDQRRALDNARKISRRHALKIIGAGALATTALISPAAYFLLKDGESTPNETEITQDGLEKVTKRCVEDFNRLFNIDINNQEITNKVKLVSTNQEFQQIAIQDKTKEYKDSIGHRLAVNMDESSPFGKMIFVNKEAIEETLTSIKREPNYNFLRDEQIEMVMKHELAHFTAKRYMSPALHTVVYGTMFANEPLFRGKRLKESYVQGAGIVTFIEDDPIGKNPFSTLEEAEAFIIADFAMRARGRKLSIVPFLPEDHGISDQATLLTRVLSRISKDPFTSIPMLQRFRLQEGGRETFCSAIAKAYPELGVPREQELFFGMSVLYTVAKGDARSFEAIAGK